MALLTPFAVNEIAAFLAIITLILLAIIRGKFYGENQIVYKINASNHDKQTVNRTPTSTPQLGGRVAVPHRPVPLPHASFYDQSTVSKLSPCSNLPNPKGHGELRNRTRVAGTGGGSHATVTIITIT